VAPLRFVLVPIVVVLALVSEACMTAPPVVPTTGVRFGAFLGGRTEDTPSLNQSQSAALWRTRQADAGRPYDIGLEFYGFTSVFPTWREAAHKAAGRTPLVSWAGADADQVASGAKDSIIKARADGLRDLGGPVFLRWFAEMNGNKKRALAKSPAQFVAAWRHVRAVFRAEGATNVAFVWCPTMDLYAFGQPDAWYPGNSAVDWTCADGYNWAPLRPKAPWQSFRTIFAPFYAWGAAKGKPMMVGEVAALERNAGEKAAWIADMGATIKASMPKLKAVVWFDIYKPEDGVDFDWRLDSSASSYAAWNALFRDPALRAQS
jgi:hypothetical protein